jgi:hypothetical protein
MVELDLDQQFLTAQQRADAGEWTPEDLEELESWLASLDVQDEEGLDAAADWDESEHPRDDDGKFTEGGGGGEDLVTVVARVPKEGVHTLENVRVRVFRAGGLGENKRGIFFGDSKTSVAPYARIHDAEIKEYVIEAKKVFVAEGIHEAWKHLYGKPLRYEEIDIKHKFNDTVKAGRWADEKVAASLRAKGYTALIWTNPLAPAKHELAVISPKAVIKEVSASLPTEMQAPKKTGDTEEDDSYTPFDVYDALESYGNFGSDQVNDLLRNPHSKQEGYARRDSKEMIAKLEAGFKDKRIYRTTAKPTWVYRGISDKRVFRALSKMRKGSVLTDRGFVSTSFNDDVARHALLSIDPKEDVFLSIRMPKGTKYLSGRRDEKEALLQNGTQFKVLRVERGSDPLEIDLEVLLR